MKALSIAILFCVSVAFGEDTNITSKVFEKRDKDGNVIFSNERVFRGSTKVLQTFSRRNKEGVMTVTGRSYFAGGELAMIESDDDGDGIFETIVIRPESESMEVFTRHSDGRVEPVSASTLKAYKKQNAAISDFWNKAFQQELSGEELAKQIQETQKKLQSAEKEKSDRAK